ncbi:hypothetical protein C8R42DRAFT_640695 [Lentinula raphanica]|nr:hypothetical protein C8R42DRAFT_640695 [Lentinula raphanica]
MRHTYLYLNFLFSRSKYIFQWLQPPERLEAKLVQPFRTSSLGNTRYISTNAFIADRSRRGLGSQICDEICKVKGTFDIRLDPMLKIQKSICPPAPRLLWGYHTIRWRKSRVNPGNDLCNRCGIWEGNNRVERGMLSENCTSTVKEFIVQSPYSYEGGDVE